MTLTQLQETKRNSADFYVFYLSDVPVFEENGVNRSARI